MTQPTAREQDLVAQLARMTSERDAALIENRLLRQKLDALARRIFGKKSEQLNENQLLLLLQEAEAPGPALGKGYGPEALATQPPRPKRPKRSTSPRIPEHLPVVEEVIVPEPVKAAPELWRKIGEEVSEQLDFEPARFLRRRLVRPKYVRRGDVDAVPVVAPLPPVLQERCIAAPGLMAHILVGKYQDHLPLYRQEGIYWSRHQISLPRQSMSRWVELAAEWLRPIYEAIGEEVFRGGYVQVDESPIRYLEPGHGKTRTGYLWVANRPGVETFYQWQTSRSAACLKELVPDGFEGTLQADGYAAYPSFLKGRMKIALAGCWAHARRGFFESQQEAPRVIGFILRQIQHLYGIESRLREERAGPRLREAVRQAESRPIIERLHRILLRLRTRRSILPQSGLGRALEYSLGQWAALQVYLGDGLVEIDNNSCERKIRPTAVGKKNWLFVGEATAGQRSAVIYTIIESCRAHGLDSYTYLREVLTRLPASTNWQVAHLTPAAWAKTKTVSRSAA